MSILLNFLGLYLKRALNSFFLILEYLSFTIYEHSMMVSIVSRNFLEIVTFLIDRPIHGLTTSEMVVRPKQGPV